MVKKDKLFTPEDFDKPKNKSLWREYKGVIIGVGVVLIVVTVACCFIFRSSNDKIGTTIEPAQTEQSVTKIESEIDEKGSKTLDERISQMTNVGVQEEEQPTRSNEAKTSGEVINQEVFTPSPVTSQEHSSNTIEKEAMNVIRGDYGNVPERRDKLGSRYQVIQNKVNELKQEGIF